MSKSLLVWLGGMLSLLGGQRLFVSSDTVSIALTVLGLAALVVGLVFRVQARGRSTDQHAQAAHKGALLLMGLGFAAVGVYFGSTTTVAEGLGLSEEGIKRWTVCFGAVWPILWLAGSVPLVLIDLAIEDSPLAVQPLRIKQARDNGLVAALGLALVFPLNYLAAEHNERWDLAYFKTTEPGTSTLALVANLTEPVHVRVFQPTSSDVTPELMPYFDTLSAQNELFTVELVDHAAEPLLTKDLKVRDNGYIALTSKDGTEEAITKTWRIGTDLDKAKRNLKKLDEEFQKRLLDLAKGDRIAYFTVGHGELNWKTQSELPDDKITGLKQILQNLNFKVKELGLTEGLGQAVPDDATVVFVLGPTGGFQAGEIQSLTEYVDRGGALVVAAEPGTTTLNPLLSHLGVKLGEGQLATKVALLRRSGDKTDNLNLVTNKYSSHDSTQTLSKYSKQMPLVLVGSGWLDETSDHRGKVTMTLRTLPDSFADLNGDIELNGEETEEIRPVAAAASGPALNDALDDDGEPAEYRAIITADAQIFSDLAIATQFDPTFPPPNAQFVLDGVNWAIGDEELTGTTESEEDIKIEHTQEDQAVWFYSTSAGIPLLMLALGVVRVRRRRSGGQA